MASVTLVLALLLIMLLPLLLFATLLLLIVLVVDLGFGDLLPIGLEHEVCVLL